jgi:hypothetical protein
MTGMILDADHSVVRKGNVLLTSVAPPDMRKKHAFRCEDTPKMSNGCHSASAELITCKNQAFGCAGKP